MPNAKTIKDKELDRDILHAIEGYSEGLKRKQSREKTGTDKTEQKGKVASEIAKLHPKRLHLKLVKIIEETASTKTFRFESLQGALPPFQAGQYINLFVNINGVETARPYAISSNPAERDYYDLTVKIVERGFVTNYLLHQLEEGQEFTATSPMGSFYHNPLFHGDDLVFLAGGSGGAPARSMILHALENDLSKHYHLIYSNSFEDDVIFQDEFRALEKQYDNFTLTEIVSRPTESSGRLTQTRIRELVGSMEGKTYYVCGPTPFNDACEQHLKALGVKDKHIRIECNGPPKQVSQLPGWPEGVSESDEVTVTIHGRGQFKAKVGEPLLNSLERNGYSAENACRSGECSLCRVKVLKGDVFNPPEAKLRKSDKDFGWTHSCVAFPTQDIEILY